MKINRAKRKSCENNHATRKCTKQHQITTKQPRKTKMHETSPNYNKTIAHNENARNKTKLQQSSRTTRKYMNKNNEPTTATTFVCRSVQTIANPPKAHAFHEATQT